MAFDPEELTLISVDDHIIEPPDLLDAHLPKRFKPDARRIVCCDDGADLWRFGEIKAPNVVLNAVAGRPKEEYGVEPQSLEEIRPGCFISDHTGVYLGNQIGIDNIGWECDYPHSDSAWPDAPEELAQLMAEARVTEAEAAKITYENAMRWYSFDPFAQWLLVDHPEEVWQFCLQAIVPDHKLS